MKIFTIFLLSTLGFISLLSGTAGLGYTQMQLRLVDMPTAGSLTEGGFSTKTYFFGNGDINTEFLYSPLSKMDIGSGWGGNNFLGPSVIDVQRIPGLILTYRAIDETLAIPGIKLGFDTQGKGSWVEGIEDNSMPNTGVFIALSKQFSYGLGDAALHAGTGYSLHPLPEHRVPHFWLGADATIGDFISLVSEFRVLTEQKIFPFRNTVNLGLNFSITSQATVGLQIRYIGNSETSVSESRGIMIDYRF
ncbi:MAG: hypothetical protein Kapaf2KO_21460 [Candidatus Kapaibacteriales bacterium]